MKHTTTYAARRDCAIPPVGRLREGDTVELTESAARYPLLRGWIAPPEAAPEPPPKPRPRRRGTRRG